MKQLWRRYAKKFDALVLRERLMVLVASGAALGFVLWTLAIEPVAVENKRLAAKLAQQQQLLREVQNANRGLQGARVDPDAPNRARREQLNRDIAAVEQKLRAVGSTLVAADQMPRLLENIFDRNRRLQLLALHSIAAAPLVQRPSAKSETKDKPVAPAPPSSTPSAGGDTNIYKHGVELTVEGSYLDLMDYLAQLEKLPWQMFWGRANLDSTQYPKVTLTLTLYTLSLDKALLTV